jgi:anti-sigma factor RsiW
MNTHRSDDAPVDPSAETREQLSAYADGELAADSRRFLLKRLAADAELKAAWSNYHLIGDSLRGQAGPPLPLDFSARVQAAIEAESAPARGYGHGIARWIGGGAVAAAVALAAIITVPQANSPLQAPGSELAEVAPTGLREQDLRPDLSRAAHTVAGQSGMGAYPQAMTGSVPVRYVPVLQPDGRLVLVPYSPLMPNAAPLETLQPPLRAANAH